MAKTSTTEIAAGSRHNLPRGRSKGRASRAKRAEPGAAGQVQPSRSRFEAVMRAAEDSGLLSEKSGRIAGRVSPALIKQAKRQTGIAADTDLIEFALATVALEDNFAEIFRKSRGKVDRDLKLGF
jgi:hypothetical protein